jgi:3-hydroxymyristoyl/3-hydroxydecanoyl-(acyl carrier protein) dehydratase
MTTRPDVLAVRQDPDGVELSLQIPPQLDYLRDHFDRFAIVPGVAEVDWAIAYAREHLGLTGTFRRMSNIKFGHPLLPNTRLTLRLSCPSDGELQFSFSDGHNTFSEGRISFGAAGD